MSVKKVIVLVLVPAFSFLAFLVLRPAPEVAPLSPPVLPKSSLGAPIASAPTRLPGSVSPRGGRRLTNADAIERLNRDSEGPWKVSVDRNGLVRRLAESSLNLGSRAPIVASEAFLNKYGESLLGVGPSQVERIQARQESRTTQVVYEQRIGDLPVFGSRLNMFFDRDGNLVYLVSDLLSARPSASGAGIDVLAAASSLRLALLRKLERDGSGVDDSSYPPEDLAPYGVLGYRLVGGGLVYRFVFNLSAPDHGDLEGIVDASSGAVLSLKTISKN